MRMQKFGEKYPKGGKLRTLVTSVDLEELRKLGELGCLGTKNKRKGRQMSWNRKEMGTHREGVLSSFSSSS